MYLSNTFLFLTVLSGLGYITALALPQEPETACDWHIDHWHCPDGIAEPKSTPAALTTATNAGSSAACDWHNDHWHCPKGVPEPTSIPSTIPEPHNHEHEEECEWHNDHWHCPEGVTEPTTAPADVASATKIPATTTTSSAEITATLLPSASVSGCEWHNDHWHCPEGVEKPTTSPISSSSGILTVSTTASTTSTTAPGVPPAYTGAAGKVLFEKKTIAAAFSMIILANLGLAIH